MYLTFLDFSGWNPDFRISAEHSTLEFQLLIPYWLLRAQQQKGLTYLFESDEVFLNWFYVKTDKPQFQTCQ